MCLNNLKQYNHMFLLAYANLSYCCCCLLFGSKIIYLCFDHSQVSNKTLEERVLKLTVFEADRHKRNVVVGHALYPMKDHYGNEKVVLWRDLERELTEVRSPWQFALIINGSRLDV